MKEPERIELSETEANDLLERLDQGQLTPGDYALLGWVLKSWVWLSQVVREKTISIQELRKLIFGAKTEKTRDLLKQPQREKKARQDKARKKGHGRNGAEAYPGAQRIVTPCTQAHAGDRCPQCRRGKLYAYAPSKIVCVHGHAPIQATIHELERLRCNLCGVCYKADAPREARGPKYDAAAGSLIALLRYGGGFPHNRLDSLQENLGVPLPSSTQWDILSGVFEAARPAGEELIRAAAGAELLHNDDTAGRILDLEKKIEREVEAGDQPREKIRTGIFTSGIIAKTGARRIALFFTGRKHAGENLSTVLEERPRGLSPPIQMCDALSRNAPKDFVRLLANCMSHGRRNFVKLIHDFPDTCQHVLETLREIYKNDDVAKESGMSDDQRLAFHQHQSKPIMDSFSDWLHEQLDQKLVEPNSRMGEAINYMINHWDALTLFLRVPGAPLDNNVCERALKVAIRHRRNSLFYKTEHGAEVGDLFMSLIHTCRLNGVNAFKYLTALQEYANHVAMTPSQWLPWNYQDALARLSVNR